MVLLGQPSVQVFGGQGILQHSVRSSNMDWRFLLSQRCRTKCVPPERTTGLAFHLIFQRLRERRAVVPGCRLVPVGIGCWSSSYFSRRVWHVADTHLPFFRSPCARLESREKLIFLLGLFSPNSQKPWP